MTPTGPEIKKNKRPLRQRLSNLNDEKQEEAPSRRVQRFADLTAESVSRAAETGRALHRMRCPGGQSLALREASDPRPGTGTEATWSQAPLLRLNGLQIGVCKPDLSLSRFRTRSRLIGESIINSKKREQAPRTPNAGATYQAPPSSAKRLECVRLAGAFALRATKSTTTHVCKNGSKLPHSKRWRDVPGACELREAFGLRPACRRFFTARDHCCPSKKREQAPRTPNAGARFVSPGPNESLLHFAPVAGHFESQFKNTFIPLVHFPPKSRFMSETIINEKPKKSSVRRTAARFGREGVMHPAIFGTRLPTWQLTFPEM